MIPTTWRQAVRNALSCKKSPYPPRRFRPQLGSLEDRLAPAAQVVADINLLPNPSGINPRQIVDVNGTAFFVGSDFQSGYELWASDGTSEGTRLVKDIEPGYGGGYPYQLTNVAGTLYFTASSNESGRELWKSDGTEAGTVLVKDIETGPYSSYSYELTNVGGTLYFTAFTSAGGVEVWKSDGTEAGTVAVSDFVYQYPYIRELTDLGGTLFFSANDNLSGSELWTTDGTVAGTTLVKDINPGSYGSNVRNLTDVNGVLFFTIETAPVGSYELWKSDGTEAGTVLVKDIAPGEYYGSLPSNLANVNGTLFFSAYDPLAGNELWKSDGTEAGTVLVKDIAVDAYYGSDPRDLVNVDGTLFFTANDGINGRELWKSDGTPGGTVLVADIVAGPYSTFPYYSYGGPLLVGVGGTVFFAFDDGVNGRELWKSDGTEVGTEIVKDIAQGYDSSYPYAMANVAGTLFLNAGSYMDGRELWKSDGTAAGTVAVRQETYGALSNYGSAPLNVDGTIYFAANDGVNGNELWKSDGTEAGTQIVSDIAAGYYSGYPTYLTNVNGTIFFTAFNLTDGVELWKTDGTADGTVLVKDIQVGPSSSYPGQLKAVGNTLYFTAHTGSSGRELWKSDGTEAGTVLVKDIRPGASSSNAYQLIDLGGKLYFTATDGSNGNELWTSDGTAAGTVMVENIAPGSAGSNPYQLTVSNNTLFFQADDGTNGTELWKSDGTAAGTSIIDIRPGSEGSYASNLTDLNGTLFFTAFDDSNGNEIWKTDGTPAGTVRVTDFAEDFQYPGYFEPSGGSLFFVNYDDTNGNELWKTDGTAAGTGLVLDINPGPYPSYIFGMTDVNGTLFFAAYDDIHGSELWKSDGTAAGTVLVIDAMPGLQNGYPNKLVAGDGVVYFAANHPIMGRELWKADAPQAGPSVTINQAAGQIDPSLTGPVQFTAVFSEPVTGFAADDVDLSLSTAPGTLLATVTESGPMDGTTYTITVSGMTNDGAVIVTIVGGAATTATNEPTPVSISTDNSVTFTLPPTVTIEQGTTQSDPATGGPIVFDVVFSEAVTGFTAASIDLTGSTVGGTLTKSVTQLTPSTYTVEVSGMFGVGDVVASVLANSVLDTANNSNSASSSVDNTVAYNGFGNISLDATAYALSEGVATFEVKVLRTGGTDGGITFDYDFTGISAGATDFTVTPASSGDTGWLSGESDPIVFTITVPADNLSEAAETINLALSNIAGSATLGTTAAVLTIAASDPLKLDATTKYTQTFVDSDQDKVTIKLTPKIGSADIYLTNGTGPIASVVLTGTESAKSKLKISVKEDKLLGDGEVVLNSVTGSGLKSLSGNDVNLATGAINLGTNYLGSLTLGRITGGADIVAGGTNTQKTKIKTNSIGPGSDITLGSSLHKLTATSFAGGTINVPSIGSMTIKGNFSGNVNVSGAGVDPVKGKAIKSLTVNGIVKNSQFHVGGSTGAVSGNIGSFTVGEFRNSLLFANYLGNDTGTTAGGFNSAAPATISSFKTVKSTKYETSGVFENSSIIASVLKSATLTNVTFDNDTNGEFGIFVNDLFKKVSLKATSETIKNSAPFTNDDFSIKVV